MRRREFIAGLAGAGAWPVSLRAQQSAMPVIGWLDANTPQEAREVLPGFYQGLAETGYVEGRNVAIEYRWAERQSDRLPALAADLARRRVAVIVTPGSTPAALAAKAATQSIPIVFWLGFDPVESGLVPRLDRPGGNVTGVHPIAAELTGKRLELLHKMVPTANLIAMLVDSTNAHYTELQTRHLPAEAQALGIRVPVLGVATTNDLTTAFASAVEQRAGAILIGGDPFLRGAAAQIISLAAGHALPAMYSHRETVAEGGLASYGPDRSVEHRQIGLYTGRILKGEKAADLPVVQSATFEFIINLQTARTLGLEISPTVLALADRVVE
jgi:putative tryptophan/tyrosine transport system substrate-binding protein